MTTARSLASSAVFSTGGIVLQGVSRLVYTVLIGRFFGTDALGHASALLSLSIFAALLWPTAAGNTASRFLALGLRRRVSDRTLLRALDTTMAVSSLVLGAVAVPVARALGNTWGVSFLAGLLVVGYGVYAFARGAQLGYGRSRRVALWDGISASVSLGALVAVCVGGLGGVVLVPLTLGYAVFAVACWPRGGDRPVPSEADPAGGALAVGDALGFARWNVLAGLTTNGLLQLAMIAAQVVAPGERAGAYAAAFTLATPASMLGQAVSQIVIPAFAHEGSRTPLRERGPLLATLAFTAVAAVVFGSAAALAPWYLPLFYPAEADEAIPYLRLLLVGVFVFTVALLPAAMLLASGRSRAVALTSATGFVVGLVVIVAAVPTAGVTAGSVGFLAGSCTSLAALVALAVGRRAR
ncbi:hypothetical protein [Frigoribacterium sp. PhB116]|uniref:lipopolysaccharide biosynthesis protein n=1 Tax=Frigoribacterium sp. PhB116 TaxID=2485174 RepID=UPI00105C3AC9|nr:hypothetical protein [Frigoribacterium sp. PhB116]TDT66060.1 O-antigen/teichoic acid export membrane protein [Frigoribacterium sp. PhB116]